MAKQTRCFYMLTMDHMPANFVDGHIVLSHVRGGVELHTNLRDIRTYFHEEPDRVGYVRVRLPFIKG